MEDQSQPQAQVWARKKAPVEFESIPRTTGPFTAVIAEYQRRIDKGASRPASRNLAWTPRLQPRTDARAVIALLEALNEI